MERKQVKYKKSRFFAVGKGLAQDGQLSSANTYDKFGIRPAFCVDSAEKIIEKEGIVNGKKVYVIE